MLMRSAFLRRLSSLNSSPSSLLEENVAARVGNWGDVLQRKLDAEHVKQVQEVRRRYEELRTQLALLSMQTQEDAKTTVLLDNYANQLPVGNPIRPQLHSLKQQWLEYKAPECTDKDAVDQRLNALQAQKLAALNEGRVFLEQLEQDMQIVRSYLQRLEQLPPYDTITLEQYFALFPEVKERIYREIEEDDNWGLQQTSPTKTDEHAAQKQLEHH
jgi:hypothetical protein